MGHPPDVMIALVADLAPGEYLLGMYRGASGATAGNLLGVVATSQ
jgi:hypothetical protein